ncbi:MAG: hypothetical protein JSR21_05230, partial [Proteobacteria bacterium]|nr:hypothetical protein [Pseudomonadota bacterium]
MSATFAPSSQPRLHEAPVSSAGIVLQALAGGHPRLSADSIRPYIGILGVL